MKFEIGEIVEVSGIGRNKPMEYRVVNTFGTKKNNFNVTLCSMKNISLKRNIISIKIKK